MKNSKKVLKKDYCSLKAVTLHEAKSESCETRAKYYTIPKARFVYPPKTGDKKPSSPPTSGSNAVKCKDK